MIESMTGFGRSEKVEENRRLTIEIKAVNHRFLDVSFKMPKKLASFEIPMRNILKEYVQRGKIDIYITYEDLSEKNAAVYCNADIAGEYLRQAAQLAQQFQLKNDLSLSQLLRMPEVFTLRESPTDENKLWEYVKPVFCAACEDFVQARAQEGQRLYEDVCCKLKHVEVLAESIAQRYPAVVEAYRSKLESKVRELLAETAIEDARIAAEVTVFADKICVDEETVRLHSHVIGARTILENAFEKKEKTEGIGRKLDFLIQEMNREANTILSKSSDVTIADYGIELKTEIERIREQIQNIE